MAKKLAKAFGDVLEYPNAGNDNYKLFFKTTQDECLILLMTEVMFEFIKLGHKQPHFIISADIGENAIKYIKRAMVATLCTVSVIGNIDNFTIDIKLLAQRIRDNTCLIIVPAVARSGIINDIKTISQLSKLKKIPLVCTIDNIFPFMEISILQTGIDIFLYNTDFTKSLLIFPQYAQTTAQQICVMGIRQEILIGYKLMDTLVDASYFSSAMLKSIIDTLVPLSAANVKKYLAVKNKFLSIFPNAAVDTVHGVIYVAENIDSVNNSDYIIKYQLGSGYVILFSIDTPDKEIDIIKQSITRK